MPLLSFIWVWGLVLLLGTVGRVGAQSDVLYEQWRWVRFTTASGLPSNTITDVFESSTGVFWVRTPKGLAWYDGFRWWPIAGEKGLPQSIISGAQSDLDGGVLVVVDAQLYRGDENGFQHMPTVFEGDTLVVSQVVPIDQQRILIFSEDDVFEYGEAGIVPVSPLPEVALVTKRRYVLRSRSGRIWCLTSAGLYEWVAGQWMQKILGHGFVDLAEDEQGNLLFTELSPDQQGLWVWPLDGQPRFRKTASGVLVKDMDVASNGDAIAGYVSGQIEIRRNGEWQDLLPVPRAMLGLRCVRYLNNGDLFVGAESGLFWHRKSSDRWHQLAMPGTQVGSSERVISEIHQARNGDLWVASLGGIFVYKPDGSILHLTEVLGTSVHAVTGIGEDAQGGIWIASGGDFEGVFRLSEGTWQHFGRDEGLVASHVHRIVPDHQGRLWFLGLAKVLGVDGDPEQGAFVYDGTRFTQWGPQEGLIHGRVYAFAEGPDGALWFGTLGGISRWLDGAWTHWTVSQGLKEDRIFTLAIDHSGKVWFGHGQDYEYGLGYLDGYGTPHYLDVTDGLLGNLVWEIDTAPDGAIWIGSRWGGMSRYKDGSFSSFGRDAGLENLGVWPILPKEDKVYIGTIGGVYVLNMAGASTLPPKVELSKPVIDVNRVVLRWKAFSFQGSLPENKIETRYRLDDGPWSYWSLAREVGPLHVGSGSHVFQVQSKGLFGNQDLTGAQVSFYIAPPFHQHPIFLGVVGIWCVSIVILGIGYWKKQRRFLLEIEARNEELESEIFEHAQVEEKLRNSEEKFRQLLENIPYGIVLVKSDGTINLINAQTEELFGYGRDELLGESVNRLIPARFHEAHLWHVASYFATPKQRLMGSNLALYGRRKDGHEFPVDISLGPVEIEGEVLIIGIIVDVTDREKLAEQFRQSQKMEAVGKLAGGVAHDFNNMLTVINGYSDMLLMHIEGDQTRRQIEEIGRAGTRAAALTRQLLAFSRKQVLQPEVLDLNVVLADISEMLRRLIGEDIEFSVVHGANGRIKADPGQLEQVFLNLAVNARDAMPQGGSLTIKIKTEAVDKAFELQNDEVLPGAYVVVSVSDTGVGMPESIQSQIFEPFFTTKEVGKGTGLGLSTVYGIVKQSGGHIFVASEEGMGTTFTLYFHQIEGEAESSDSEKTSVDSYRGEETILLVEDEEIVRTFARRVLNMNGYVVFEADSGEKALEFCETHEGVIDLLLTDVVMPRLSGREVAEEIQTLYKDVKILFMSGYTDDAIGQYGVEALDAEFIHKPFAPEALLKKVRDVLDA